MKKNFLSVIIIVVTLIVTGKNMFSENLAKIVVNKKIDICNPTQSRFNFVVNIGYINSIDSLFGFDLDIKYDPNKIRILNYLKPNTLSETFDVSSFSFGVDTNYIRGYATTFNFNAPPAYGDSILIGFYAEWIGDRECEDSSIIELVDINFTEEFKKEYQYQEGLIRTSLSNGNKSLEFSAKIDIDTVNLKEDENYFSFNMKLKYPEAKKDYNITMLLRPRDTINIKKIVSECDECITGYNSEYINIKLPVKSTEFNMNIEAEYIYNDSLKNIVFKIDTIDLHFCNCIGVMNYDSIVVNKTIIPKSIEEKVSYNGILELKNGTIYYLYDYEGRLIETKQVLESDSKLLNLNNYQGNVFLLIIESANNKIEYNKIYKYINN